MSAEALRDHLRHDIDELAGRVQLIADLQELIRRDQLPQAPAFAFVLPLGLNALSQGEAAANAFTQLVDEIFGVVLVCRAAGDLAGSKTLPILDRLIWKVIASVSGLGDERGIGVYRLQRGRLVSLQAGTAFYQLDFARPCQIRVLT